MENETGISKEVTTIEKKRELITNITRVWDRNKKIFYLNVNVTNEGLKLLREFACKDTTQYAKITLKNDDVNPEQTGDGRGYIEIMTERYRISNALFLHYKHAGLSIPAFVLEMFDKESFNTKNKKIIVRDLREAAEAISDITNFFRIIIELYAKIKTNAGVNVYIEK